MKLYIVTEKSIARHGKMHVTCCIHIGGHPAPGYHVSVREVRSSSCAPAGVIVERLEAKLKRQWKGKGIQFLRPVYHAPRPQQRQLTESERAFLALIMLNHPALRHAD